MSDALPEAPVRRARVAVSLGFAAQGFVLLMLLLSLDSFKTRYGVDDATTVRARVSSGTVNVTPPAASIPRRTCSAAAHWPRYCSIATWLSSA